MLKEIIRLLKRTYPTKSEQIPVIVVFAMGVFFCIGFFYFAWQEWQLRWALTMEGVSTEIFIEECQERSRSCYVIGYFDAPVPGSVISQSYQLKEEVTCKTCSTLVDNVWMIRYLPDDPNQSGLLLNWFNFIIYYFCLGCLSILLPFPVLFKELWATRKLLKQEREALSLEQ